MAEHWGWSLNENELRTAYLKTPVRARRQYGAVVGLLNIFAQHLSVLSNQLLLQQAGTHAEPPIFARARAFVEEHFTEQISLRQAAAAARVSPFHFCKVFKRVTGLTFTVFVARHRIEKAKNLLFNAHYRISEICYAVGFESLSHFNRRFYEYVGESPTSYRRRLQRGLVNGPKNGTRPGATRAAAGVNGTGATEFLIRARSTAQASKGEWLQPPHLVQTQAGKGCRNGSGSKST